MKSKSLFVLLLFLFSIKSYSNYPSNNINIIKINNNNYLKLDKYNNIIINNLDNNKSKKIFNINNYLKQDLSLEPENNINIKYSKSNNTIFINIKSYYNPKILILKLFENYKIKNIHTVNYNPGDNISNLEVIKDINNNWLLIVPVNNSIEFYNINKNNIYTKINIPNNYNNL